MDDDVGLLADLDRTDAVGEPDRLGAGDGGQFEHLVGTEARRVEPGVAGDAGGQRGGAQDVDRVAGVGRVAPERDPPAALDDLGVTAVGEHALAEPEVRPRAVGDRRLARQDQFDLGVVEPHAVADEQVTTRARRGRRDAPPGRRPVRSR